MMLPTKKLLVVALLLTAISYQQVTIALADDPPSSKSKAESRRNLGLPNKGDRLGISKRVIFGNSVKQHIEKKWVRPKDSDRLNATVELSLTESGDVTNVSIVESSKSFQFDNSILDAVRKSSPLPAPPGEVFEQFKTFRITFQ